MKPVPPICPYDNQTTGLVGGAVIYPHRQDLFKKWFWRCPGCGAYVGCHPGTKRALGLPADLETRRARGMLHERMIDPLWKTAVESCGYEPEDPRARRIIMNAARTRVYAWLAYKMGLTQQETHTGQFSVVECRRAWIALKGVTYPEIRDWAKARPKEPT